MKYGDSVRVRKEPHIVFKIKREQFGQFGRETTIRSFTDRILPLTVWYSPEELEVIE